VCNPQGIEHLAHSFLIQRQTTMHFAIATAILVQTIGTTSAKPDNVLLPKRGERRKERMPGMLMKHHTGGSRVAPIERPLLQVKNYHDTADEHMPVFVDRSSPVQVSGGALKNTNKKVECDPSSEELDVGVLSCGMGKYCEESTDSLLGGLCEKVEQVSSFSRILDGEYESYSTYYCDTMNCDCDLLDRETATGKVVCNTYADCCAPDDAFCASTTYTINLVNDERLSWTGCYDFTVPYSRSVCRVLGFSNDEPETCEWSVDDETCTSCNLLLDNEGYVVYDNEELAYTVFDCTNVGVDEAIAGDSSEFGPLPIHDMFLDIEADLVCPEVAPNSAPAAAPPTSAPPTASTANVSNTTAVLICVLVSTLISSLIGSY
jgi:hypothetical protein